ncbi:bifunctional adenosylcobinamide kinase/adenosylcobinamide-phosphate guanylyltransferase [Actinomycetospora chibensis]|nr:bifunctional adenosylcobinamide kinase/adenosylcobinamide-phosphate guanylyltransferase [Actinomycetospora chibensis]MDD7925499.1 bifunctional adenosylcobinamide kinase/adenosylcobinamide-phosphate guanylyltransferase [Actinomycetospora chibensis]
MRTLVLGGTRSGKSAYAEGMLDADAPVLYVATARGVDPGLDPEWADRVAVHRARRPASWRTVEDADLPAVLDGHPGDPVLVDDLATWVTGLLDDAGWERDAPSVDAARTSLTAAVDRFGGTLVLVSAEVGLGVVPSTSAGRRFRDELGAVNQALAAVCDEVWLLVAGVPLRLR